MAETKPTPKRVHAMEGSTAKRFHPAEGSTTKRHHAMESSTTKRHHATEGSTTKRVHVTEGSSTKRAHKTEGSTTNPVLGGTEKDRAMNKLLFGTLARSSLEKIHASEDSSTNPGDTENDVIKILLVGKPAESCPEQIQEGFGSDQLPVDGTKTEAMTMLLRAASAESDDRLLGDMTKNDATKMAVGTCAGCVAGWLTMKAGKVVALVAGSGVLLLLAANRAGYVAVNWHKMAGRADALVRPMASRRWVDRVESYVDDTLERLEDKIVSEANRQWTGVAAGQARPRRQPRPLEAPVSLVSFLAGVALGVAFG